MHRVLALLAALATAPFAAALAAPNPAPAAEGGAAVPVLALSTTFAPPALVVPKGTTVQWLFVHGLIPHTVTTGPITTLFPQPNDPGNGDGNPDTFDHPLGAGQKVSHTFDNPGTYTYFCATHYVLGMRGVVVVQDSSPE